MQFRLRSTVDLNQYAKRPGEAVLEQRTKQYAISVEIVLNLQNKI